MNDQQGATVMIYRAEHTDNFTKVQNQLIGDERLSIEARGFMIFILSLPNDWSFSIKGLCSAMGLGQSTVQRLINELKTFGYAKCEKERGKGGKIVSHHWSFYEEPDQMLILPDVENTTSGEHQMLILPDVDFTTCGKSTHIQTTNIVQTTKLVQTTNIYKEKYGEFSNVALTPEEFKKLEDKLGTERRDALIFELSCYLKNHPKKYKDHYATILSWSRKKGTGVKRPPSSNPFDDLLREEGYE